jgi:hypothetical protein
LFVKQYNSVNTNLQRLDAYTSLNDDADPLYSSGSSVHIIGESREINAWAFTLTVMFGI